VLGNLAGGLLALRHLTPHFLQVLDFSRLPRNRRGFNLSLRGGVRFSRPRAFIQVKALSI
jgi:hypothetical protein